jgi:ABC-type glycerol-3-phosphate transport system permease component
MRRVRVVGMIVGVGLVVLFALFPFYWIVMTSLKTPAELSQPTHGLVPAHFTISAYGSVFTEGNFLRALINSAIVSLFATAISVVLATLAGYALARLEMRGKSIILGFILLTAFFPVIAMVGPLFLAYRHLGLLDSYQGLVITYLIYTLPIATWLLTNFFQQIPRDLEEAAMVDGSTRLQALWHVVTPVALPGIFTAAILSFILAWNDFAFALSFISSPSKYTAPLAIVNVGQSQFQVFYNRIDAAVVITTLPVALVVLLGQKRIVSGLTAGAVK